MTYNNIKYFRLRRHLTQRQLAAILNKTQNRIHQWEHNKAYVRAGHRHAIAQALNATEAQIFGAPPPTAPQAPHYEPSEP